MHQSSATLAVEVADAVEAPARPIRHTYARHPSLAVQFLIANLVVLVLSMGVVGAWVGAQIEAGVLDHAAAAAAFYVDSVVSPSLQVLATRSELTDDEIAHMDWLLDATLRGQRVVEVKVWSTDGFIRYSHNRALIGRQYPIDDDLSAALRGNVNASLSDLRDEENEYERQLYSRLLSVYAPIRASGDGRIIGVSEFYQPPDELDADIAAARARTWLVVGVVTVAAYLLLAGIVKRGSDTIIRQAVLLRRQFGELSLLHERVRQAAARSTSLNEQALRRISADLHDGPGQTLALALLRLDSLRELPDSQHRGPLAGDFTVVHGAVRDALAELRSISASLRTPELDGLSVSEIAERAVDAHQRRTGAHVELHPSEAPQRAPLAVKIAILRTLQEALSNATRHGGLGSPIDVELRRSGEALHLTVTDRGRGFDPQRPQRQGRLGLIGMRERAELLGGTFDIRSRPGHGTVVHASWPVIQPDDRHG